MSDENTELKIEDKRHWVTGGDEDDSREADVERLPTYVEELIQRADEKEAKLKEYIAAYKEKMAENDQFRARLQKDVDRRVEAGIADFIKELLPVVDSIDLAIGSAGSETGSEKLAEGVVMIKTGIMNVIKNTGVTEVECVGKDFDPAMSEAIGMESVDETMDNKVTEVLQPGYMLNERLIRPAKDKVGKAAGR
jgi:molecular chaperone GrpE